ncbi:MAG: protein-L-isoaspartate O-methyltransferase [Bacteroidetes bacterium GWF2_38_335]|nr:MAG: protein-L-isoaspartate O-methyltransferase [Bacteroidetes bacterium GWF2_38_335]OFY78772.1 MAG: protein-L-isoaspartate O-methyltransferase [Bacteroidetes bacterium RIFOXYA12_FULL_38_20]HBS85166.1 protein-L-isoaspartate O-methyltransferase [Bacteroidales bacterium]
MLNDTHRHKGLRKKLVDELRRKGIANEEILEAINRVPRHLFMDSGFIDHAYVDKAFPIAAGQTISQPYTVAFQTSLLEVKRGDKILEIGTGSGYQAAVLLELGARVYTIERQKELFMSVQKFLPKIGYHPQFFFGDGYLGKENYGPFDKILITAAAPYIPDELLKQLKTNGIFVAPVGGQNAQKMLKIIKKGETDFETTECGDFVFVPMLKGTDGQ